MNVNIKYLFALNLLLLLIYNCTETKSETAKEQQEKPKIPSYIKAFEDTLKSRLAEEKIPGAALAIVRDSAVIYMQTFGYANSDSNTVIDSSTAFRLASLSKGFAGVLSGILVDEGLLEWNDPVIKHYPDFSLKDSAQATRVQVRHLLSHSSGLPYHAYTNLIEDGLSLEDIIPRLAKLDLIAAEGEVYAYQNAAFAIIEKVIESAADTTFSVVLENKIFKTAGMQNASSSYTGLVESGNFARPHHFSALEQRYVRVRNSKK